MAMALYRVAQVCFPAEDASCSQGTALEASGILVGPRGTHQMASWNPRKAMPRLRIKSTTMVREEADYFGRQRFLEKKSSPLPQSWN